MSRTVGTVVRGIRTPIIREGDDVAQIVATSVLEAAASEGFAFQDRDVVAATEAIVARRRETMPPWTLSPRISVPNFQADTSA